MSSCKETPKPRGKKCKEKCKNPVFQPPKSSGLMPKHWKLLMRFLPSAICYGMASGGFVTYMTDWKVIVQYLPFYNGKFKQEEAPVKKTAVVAGEGDADVEQDAVEEPGPVFGPEQESEAEMKKCKPK